MAGIVIFVDTLGLCIVFFSSSFGILGLSFLAMRSAARKPWRLHIDWNYKPRISIIVPTYNESDIIHFKLRNLAKINYPEKLLQIVFVDSHSTDSTMEMVQQFAESNLRIETKRIIEDERKGKSFALNTGLRVCTGDVIVVSDADCFWPPDILNKALTYLSDPSVGAVSGPKKLLNSDDSSVTRSENRYLESMNLMKLGESKKSSTIFFEGGFSAFKRGMFDNFDPYNTGSDDCGTVIQILENGARAIMIPEAEFFTTFPKDLSSKVEMKVRRSVQLVKLLTIYAGSIARNRIKGNRGILIKNLLLYLVAPIMFLLFVTSIIFLVLDLPWLIFVFGILLVPEVRGYILEVSFNYIVLVCSMFLALMNRKSVIWRRPSDRFLLTEEMLVQKNLI